MEAEVRSVDTTEYVNVLRSLTEEGKECRILVTGSSMAPFLIHGRDYAFFKKPDRDPKRGDIVFYQRKNGAYILHRVLRVHDGSFDMIGDNQSEVEKNIGRDQIFAVVTKVSRKGRMIGPGDFWWKFFAGFWLAVIPFRRFLAGAYARIVR